MGVGVDVVLGFDSGTGVPRGGRCRIPPCRWLDRCGGNACAQFGSPGCMGKHEERLVEALGQANDIELPEMREDARAWQAQRPPAHVLRHRT